MPEFSSPLRRGRFASVRETQAFFFEKREMVINGIEKHKSNVIIYYKVRIRIIFYNNKGEGMYKLTIIETHTKPVRYTYVGSVPTELCEIKNGQYRPQVLSTKKEAILLAQHYGFQPAF
jgi:hypothetical protein